MGKESKIIGNRGEEQARTYLEQKGYLILERNYHSQQGEIDIIARDKEMLVFVEVKSYSFRSLSSPLFSVRKSKRESIIHAARTYIMKNSIKGTNCRFDVLAFYRARDGRVVADHIKDAFYVSLIEKLRPARAGWYFGRS
jgi:putative endonuclease